MDELKVRDSATKQIFKVRPTENTQWITTRDGVRVRLHPIIIRTMVRKGEKFEGHTIFGDREMMRV